MPKTYKILIVITFLIAAFFLVKWVNEVRPRYEWQYQTKICTEGSLFMENKTLWSTCWNSWAQDFQNIKEDCKDHYWCGDFKRTYGKIKKGDSWDSGYSNCYEEIIDEDLDAPIHKIITCYIKEKVRTK